MKRPVVLFVQAAAVVPTSVTERLTEEGEPGKDFFVQRCHLRVSLESCPDVVDKARCLVGSTAEDERALAF
ncbi:hypothetical protein B0T25DRAFT_530873 [Lasiosphaeria hispida]|uniref:Uncharacterized protein n=1 Tax=Lasiosphaeria hispida TaxID=260671 RepID=A0AAJ0HP85_9PEZI|nr:hypothetical protein B0T25DRAFT_530873 [Lasiosphaeria hispida]